MVAKETQLVKHPAASTGGESRAGLGLVTRGSAGDRRGS